MKVRDVFYKAPRKLDRKYMVNHVISGWALLVNLWRVHPKDWKRFWRLAFSHEETWFPDDDGNFEVNGKFVGSCVSSTMRDGANGIRFEDAAKVLRHPERWGFFEVDIAEEKRSEMRVAAAIEAEEKTSYDLWGALLGFATPFNIGDDEYKWYCSELSAYLKYAGGIFTKLYDRISPRWSAWLMVKMGHELKPLGKIIDKEA